MKKLITLLIALSLMVACNNKENTKITTGKSEVLENVKTQRLDSVYSAHFDRNEFNGNVLVAEKGKVIFQKSYGISNEETNETLNNQTAFELASVSKQFTAMGIVQLEKEGKLSYEDPISKYVPELKHYQGVTIKNLLIHTGGLPDYMSLMEENWDKSKIATNEDVIEIFEKLKPKKEFEPNQEYSYSNTGYLLLGTIIERVSGKSFEDYLNEKIFTPLEMKNSFVYRRRFNPKRIDNYAIGYIYSDSLKQNIVPDESPEDDYIIYLDGIVGDGMVNSNTTDLFKWDRALYGNELINAEDKKLIFSSYKTETGEETKYGFGWDVSEDSIYGKRVMHTGRWAGYLTLIERHIDTDKTIIQLINVENKITANPAKYARNILYNQPIKKPFTLSEKVLKKYVGTYVGEKNEREITFEFGRLWAGNGQFELKPISENEFIIIGFNPKVTFEFNMDNEGGVNSYRVQQEETGLDKTLLRKK
ncbi:MAG: serine hydrolase domain-containing protein [Bacteroidota bacterium]